MAALLQEHPVLAACRLCSFVAIGASARLVTVDKEALASGHLPVSSMRAIWKGSISFGLVNIPIALYPAVKEEELRFHLLRKTDLSPINFKRVAEADGKVVEWADIVKGYQYEKGKYVVLKEEDFRRVDVEATHSIDIVDFVALDEINPMHFDKPYYVEPGKGSDRAFALLRSVLVDTGKVGIAKVVIRTRQHLAAVKPNGKILVLELMHFDNEILPADAVRIPASAEPDKREMNMAKALVESMTHPWDPKEYADEYSRKLLEIIDEKIAAGGKDLPAVKDTGARKATNVIDLVSVLQRSIDQSSATRPARSRSGSRKSSERSSSDRSAAPKSAKKPTKSKPAATRKAA